MSKNIPDDIKQQIIRSATEPIYFIKTFCKIQHPLSGLIPFDLFDFQEEIIKTINENRFSIYLKARQLGFTTVVSAYMLWLGMFHKDKTILIVSKDKDASKELIYRAKVMYQNLPAVFKKLVKLDVDNVYTTEFANRSRIQAVARTKDVGKSKSISLLIFDEAAAIDDFEDIYSSCMPTIFAGGTCVVMSTPKGRINFFAKLYLDAEQGLNKFISRKYPWNVHPEHDQRWFDEETKNYKSWQIAENFLCDFGTSQHTFIDNSMLDLLKPEEPLYREYIDRNLWIWERPQEHKKYVVSVDVSRGDGKDYQAIIVLSVNDWVQVAEYKGLIPTNELGILTTEIAKNYNNAHIIVDLTGGYGIPVTNEILLNQKYFNVYFSEKGTGRLFLYQDLETGLIPGVTISVKNRPILMDKLEQSIRENLITIKSSRLLNELRTFVWKNGKPQADSNANDDLVLSLSLNLWAMQKTNYTFADEKIIKGMISNFKTENKQLKDMMEPDKMRTPNEYFKGYLYPGAIDMNILKGLLK